MKNILRRIPAGKYLLLLPAVLLLYTLAGFFALPYAIRWYVPKYASEKMDCRASIGKVRINPFLLTFEANEFSLTGSDGAPIAGFGRLFLDLEISSVTRRAGIVRDLQLDHPSLHVVVENDGSINLARLGSKTAQPDASPSKSEPIKTLFHSIAIIGADVALTDKRQSTPASLNFNDINLNLKSLSTLTDQNGTYALSGTTSEGETIEWQGDLALVPFRSTGKVACRGIQAATLWRFLRDSLNLDAPAGNLDLSTDYRLDASITPLHVSLENFRVDLSKVSLRLAGSEKVFLGLDKLELGSARFDLAERALQVGSLLIDGGAVQVRIDEAGRSNIEDVVLRKSGKAEKPSEQPQVEEAEHKTSGPDEHWNIVVDQFELRNIAFGLEDLSRASPFKADIAGISVRSKANIETGAKKMNLVVGEINTNIKGVQLGSAGTPAPLFKAEGFAIEGAQLDLGKREIVVSRVALSDGQANLSRNPDGVMNWAQVFAGKTGAKDSPKVVQATHADSSAWKFLIKEFDLTGFRTALSDHAAVPGKPLYNIKDLSAKIRNIDGKSPMDFNVRFLSEQGGSVDLQGKVDPAAQSVESKLKVTGLVLDPVQPYLEPYITLVLQSANVSAQGLLRYGPPKGGAQLSYEGSFSLDNLSLTEPGSKETYLGWKGMAAPQVKLSLQPDALQIGEIKLSKPVGQFIIAQDGTVNLSKILKNKASEGKPDAPVKTVASGRGVKAKPSPAVRKSPEKESFPFKIGKIQVDGGNVLFADFSLRPQYMARIHELKGTISGLSSARKSLAQIQLDGRVDKYGLARVNGGLDLYDVQRSTDITVIFRNVEMASITPYSGKFAGRKIKSGKLSMDLKYKIENRKLVGDNKIIVENLVLGEHVESADAVNLPLDLAIALLSDSNGKIDIGLPVSGDLSDPKFSIGPLIWKALTNIITKAVTAPFRALGSLFGGSAEKFDAVAFDAGKSELLPPEKEKLTKVADALKKRPQLKLNVQGRYNSEADGLVFKHTSVRSTALTRLGSKPDSDEDPGPLDFSDSKMLKVLEKMYTERFGSPAMDELDRAVKDGSLKPRPVESAPPERKKAKRGRFTKVMDTVKIYKVIPGAKSPEQSEILARELYARLVESEQVPEERLGQLAKGRAQIIMDELQKAGGIPADRVIATEPEQLSDDEGLSAKLSLDVL